MPNLLLSSLKNKLANILLIATLFAGNAYATPPSFSAQASPDSVGPGSVTNLTFTITNGDLAGIRNLDFTNTLPAGLTHATSANPTTTCTGGNLSAVSGGSTLTFTGYSIAPSSSCTVSVDILTSTTAGVYSVLTDDLTSDEGNSGTATEDINVVTTLPGYSISISPSTIVQGTIATLTQVFDNTQNANNYGSLDSTIILSSGLVVADVPNITSTCGEASVTLGVSGSAGSSSIVLNADGANFAGFRSLPAGDTCTVSIDVKATGVGTLEAIESDALADFIAIGGGKDTLVSTQAFAQMSIADNPTSPGSSTSLVIDLSNFDRGNMATNIAFTVDLDAALSGLVATSLPITDECSIGSSITTSDGGSTIAFSGGSINAESTCSIRIPIAIPVNAAVGTYSLSTSSFSLDVGGSSTSENSATTDFTITQAPTVSLNFIDASVVAGGVATVDFTVENTDAVNAATDIALRANIGAMLSGATFNSLPAANTCGTGSTFTQTVVSDENILVVNGANLVASASCIFSVAINIPEGTRSGAAVLSTSDFSATINGSSYIGINSNGSFNVVDGPTLTLSFSDNSAGPGETLTATFELTHDDNAPTDATAIAYSLDLDSVLTGMVATGLPLADVCGSGSSISGTGLLTFAAGSLTAGETCSFAVDLVIPGAASPGSYTLVNSAVTATVDSLSTTSSTSSSSFLVSTLNASMQFTDDPVGPNDSANLRVSFENINSGNAITDIQYTLNLTQMLPGTTVTGLPLADVCGAGSSLSAASGNTFIILTSGNLAALGSCIIDLPVLVPGGATTGDYNAVTSSVSYTDGVGTTTDPMFDILQVVVDEAPDVTVSSASSPSTSVSPIPISIVFNEDVTGFDISDISGSVTNGTLGNFVAVSATEYTVEITPTADGEVTLQVPASSAIDAGSNNNNVSNLFSINFDAVAYVLPTVAIGAPDNSLTNAGPVNFPVTYSDADPAQIDLDETEVNLVSTGTATATIIVLNGATANPTVELSSISGDGSLAINLDADTARNGFGSTAATGDSTRFNVDNTQPDVSITSGAPDPTNSSFNISIAFTEAMNNFVLSDITANNATISGLAGGPSTYTATVNPVDSGTVTIDIAANIATDAAGNGNTVASQFSLEYDESPPTGYDISIDQTFLNAANDTAMSFSYTGAEIGTAYNYDVSDGGSTVSGSGTIASASGSFTGIDVSGLAEGTLTLTFVLTDSLGNVGVGVTDTIVKQYNDAPIITEGASTTVIMSEDGTPTVFSLTLNATDPESETLTWSVSSQGSDGTASTSGTGNSKAIDYIPTPDFNGIDSFTIEITDNNALDPLTDSIVINVTINPENDQPSFSSSAVLGAAEDNVYVYSITTADIDLGDSLAITASTLPSWLGLTDNGDGTATLTGTPLNNNVGANSVTLVVSDDSGAGNAAATQSFAIMVVNTNDSPVIDSTAVTAATEDSVYTYAIVTSDIDVGDTRAISASVLPSWLNVTDNGDGTASLTGTPLNANVGNNNVTLVVTDLAGATDTQSFVINVVNTNDAPSFVSSAVTSATEDNLYTYSVTTADIDLGDSLAITASTLPSWLGLTDNGDGTATLTGTPLNNNVGANSVTLVVSDDSGAGNAAATQSFAIMVVNTNDSPVIDSTAVTAATEDSVYTYAIVTSDIDVGDTRAISASVLPSWLNVTDNGDGTASLTGTPLNANVGNNNVTLVVTDLAGATDTQPFVIVVENSNDLPTGGPVIEGTLLRTETLTVNTSTITDDDGLTPYSYQWYRSGQPIIGAVSNSYLLGNDDVSQTMSIEISYTDLRGAPELLVSPETGPVSDLDSDGDGIGDLEEGTGDSDGDGIPDYLDEDSDNDGIPDSEEGNGDSDDDGIPDYLDTSLDEDGDGIPDRLEGGPNTDTDGDGVIDALDADSDNDGITDFEESGALGVDTDGDGIDDAFDVDVTGGEDLDGDGIDDLAALLDSDGDGIADYQDRDSDNDSIPDALENRVGLMLMASNPTHQSKIMTVSDADGDGIQDHIDPDSDQDGISDLAEAATIVVDSDLDQIIDQYDVDFTGGADTNLDGVDDAAVLQNSDNDISPDMFDLDADNDGLLDVAEALLTDLDIDGLVDTELDRTDTPIDSDNDGLPDYRDLDSNNDGILDIVSSGAVTLDTNANGQIDDATDADNDGIADVIDDEPNQFGTSRDRDLDGIPSSLDKDDDNDGIADVTEGILDSDADGIIDSLDADSDNDGLSDMFEADRPSLTGLDSDLDGIDNAFDVDYTGGLDDDGDGIDDSFVVVDTDGDLVPDYLDSDSDGDSISDTEEQLIATLSGLDVDTDGLDDDVDADFQAGVDANGDNQIDSSLSYEDMDGDGKLAFRDVDTDGDGITDINENGDFNGDGINDRLQVEIEVKAVSGSGSFGWSALIALLLLTSRRIGKSVLIKVFLLSMICFGSLTVSAKKQCEQTSLCWYVGVSAGTASKEPVVEATSWSTDNQDDLSVKFTFGADLTKNWFAEFSYHRLGKAKLSSTNQAFRNGYINYNASQLSVGYKILPQSMNYGFWFKGGFAEVSSNSNFILDANESVSTLGVGVDWYEWEENSVGFSLESIGKDIYSVNVDFKTYF